MKLLQDKWRTVRGWWESRFLTLELWTAVLAAATFIFWVEKWNGHVFLQKLLQNNRAAIYGALASIFGSLLGFSITAASVVLGFANTERLAVVRESKHYSTLWKVFTSTIRALGFATAAAMLALIIDRDGSTVRVALYFAVFGLILASLRLTRCVWVLEKIIALISAPSKRTTT